MAEDWELNSLERRMAEVHELKSLERRVETLEEQSRRRAERMTWLVSSAIWTFYAVALTTLIVLSATGTIHHH